MKPKTEKNKTPKQTMSQKSSQSSRGAISAQAGYEYQLNVSVLAALRLLLIAKSATRITLEPANEEDLEADLVDARPGRVAPSADLARGYKLIVQVKSRSGEPWSIEDFDNLLNYGEMRMPAKQHLDDLNVHYLLVTNAYAKGIARDLLVWGFEEEPDRSEFPESLRKTLPNKPEGRVAIWGGLTERAVESDIEKALRDLLRVPHSRQKACLDELRQQARNRMQAKAPGVWTRDDLQATIRDFGGYFASDAELVAFVSPSNFKEMEALLLKRNAIVITGPSGTGKTLAALKLCELMRQYDGNLEVVVVDPNNDPSMTRRLGISGPTLLYLEDPWGQYNLRGGSEAWTEHLPRLMRAARPDHRYVVTSRSDMLGHANAGEDLKPWTIKLDAENYVDGELLQIYNKRMGLLATNLQGLALTFSKDVLEVLATPLELDLFFTNLADGKQPGEENHVLYRRLLGVAHRDAVEGVVVKYLRSIDKIGLSTAIWGLLVARGHFDRAQMTGLQRQLRKTDRTLGNDLERIVDRLIATRHLRQPARTISFAHPSVRAGFEVFLKENWVHGEDDLKQLISVLTELGGDQRAWGLETAARILGVVVDFSGTFQSLEERFEASSEAQASIDNWFDEALVDLSADFQALLQLSANVGSGKSAPSELARWFLKGTQRGGEFFIDDWQPPVFDDAWYERIRNDARTVAIAERFVREQLPFDDGAYDSDFLTKLDRITDSLTPAFVAAAKELVGRGYNKSVQVVAMGAIRDVAAFESVLVDALDELKAIRISYEQDTGETRRAIEDGERDAAYDEYFNDHHDEGFSSEVFVDTYIDTIRALSWSILSTHERVAELADRWASNILKSMIPVTVEEVSAMLDAIYRSKGEYLGWECAGKYWHSSLNERLGERILSEPSDEILRRGLVRCAVVNEPGLLINYFKSIAGMPANFMRVLTDVHDLQVGEDLANIKTILVSLDPDALLIFDALPTEFEGPKAIAGGALALLYQAANCAEPNVLAKIIPVILASGGRPSEAIFRWLSETSDYDAAAAATRSAIEIRDEAAIELALGHPRASARKLAFEYLADMMPDPLSAQLLNLKSDPSNQVRRSLVSKLSDRLHSDHLRVLVFLAEDQWSDAEPYYDEPSSYKVAREAVAALNRYANFSRTVSDELVQIAVKTDDRRLRCDLFEALARRGGPEIQKILWSFVEQKQLGWTRVDAIDALSAASELAPDIVAEATVELLMRSPAPIATSAAVLISRHLPVPSAVQILERVAHSNLHRTLLLVGVTEIATRDRSAALNLLKLLAVDHPARRILDLNGEILPPAILDDLGDVRIRRHVQLRLKNFIQSV